MSSEGLRLEKDLCRCCHSEGTYKSLYAPYFWLDIEEVVYYSKLQECFGIELAPITQPSYQMLCAICEVCIQKLQDAMAFKLQVQQCEKIFQEKYLKKIEYPFTVDIKKEIDDLDANVANIIAGGCNGEMEDDLGCSKMANDDDDDEGSNDYEDEKDFVWSDEEEMPIQGTKESKDESTKKSPPVKIAKPPDEVVEAIQGIMKVVRRPCFQLLEGKDYTCVGNVFTCSSCEKTFKALQNLRVHFKNIHANIARYTCPVCFKKLTSIRLFKNHKLEEHNIDDRFKCNACDKAFIMKRELTNHMSRFHKLGVMKKCDKCDFETYGELDRHMRVHKTVKDYHCSYCTKSFKSRSTLKFHERIHTGDKRKVCKECGQAFVQKASLNYHMSKYHPGVKF